MRVFTILAICFAVSWSLAEAQEAKFKMTDLEKSVLDATNAERKQAELPPLTPNPLLWQVARAHSVNMGKQGKMEHELDGKNPFDRLKAAGYRYSWAGENIAYGDPRIPVKALMKAWMDSKVHRENILGKNFTEIGIGVVAAPDGQLYYTQVFGNSR